MRIFIDIGHPAHVHYFRNFISIMKQKGHSFYITAREKEFSHQLLKSLDLSFTGRGKGGKGFIGKYLYMLKADLLIWKLARKFRPDLFMSFCTPYLSHAAFLLGKPAIVIDDTDHAALNHTMYKPFAHSILTPEMFLKDFGRKHIRFNGYFESIYLHKKFFTPDHSILEELQIKPGEFWSVVRFVSWDANHDMLGQNKGLNLKEKISLVENLSKKGRVFISSEVELPSEIEQFKLRLPPEKIHHIMAFASLFIGESLTMASESALLGTPSLCISTADAGTLRDQVKRGLIIHFKNIEGLFEKIEEIYKDEDYKNRYKAIAEKYFRESICVTDFLVWFVENYPQSREQMLKSPEIQNSFR